MKKLLIMLVAVTVLFSSAAFADDLSAMTDEELLALHQDVLDEMARRQLPDEQETDSVTAEITDRVFAFFAAWNRNDQDEMLAMCSSAWKATVEEPRVKLFGILANRTALDAEILAVDGIAGEDPDDPVRYQVTVTAHLDRNNGKAPDKYYIQLLVSKGEDGLWYIDPTGLESRETVEEDAPAETAEEQETRVEAALGDTVLYYHPDGGEYYHLDANCQLVNPAYLPLEGRFLLSELNDEPYRDLKPCEICGAPARRAEQPAPAAGSFREAADAVGDFAAISGNMDYLAVAAEKGGRYYRSVTLLDDRAKELYMAAIAEGSTFAEYEAFEAYAWDLPVCYTEELTAKPKDQAELDALAGKTIGELLNEGYSYYGIGGGEGLPTVVDLQSGLFIYEFEVDASFEQYQEQGDWDNVESMKVLGGKRSDSLMPATNLDYLADGTFQPQVVPNVTAEEAAAADSVPPLDEYSMKAWPLDAEGYSDLQDHIDARYGQVYTFEGVVRQVLSRDPLKAVVCTGEDGVSQPVIVECPAQRGFSLEEGLSCRFYADVTSACYILPVLTARYMFTGPSESPADESPAADEGGSVATEAVPANGIGDFLGEWQYVRIVNADGTEMNREDLLAGGLVDDHAEFTVTEDEIILYTASLGNMGSVKYEFIPEDGTLKILNGDDESPVLRLDENGMLVFFMPSGVSSGGTTAYLTRK